MTSDFESFKRRALKRPAVRKAYDALAPEFGLLALLATSEPLSPEEQMPEIEDPPAEPVDL